MPIFESDLIPGDVIFFTNVYRATPGDEDDSNQPYVDHVGLFVGCDEANNPRIVHSITGSKGHYYPEKISGLCITTLRALPSQVQEDGRVYDVTYDVFRSKFPKITEKALEILMQQATYRLPYDEKRLERKLELEEIYNGDDFKRMSKKEYYTSGIYRSIKYAARHPHLLTRTRGDGVGRGLTCSMSVILAYQIAELLLDDKIIPLNPSKNEWPSDKYAKPLSSSKPSLHSEAYTNYLDNLQPLTTPGALRRQQSGLKLSINFWKGDTPPEEYRHKTYALDCKSAGAEGMYLYMKESANAWEYLGGLEVALRTYSPGDKSLHRQKLVEAYRNFICNVRKEVSNVPLSCSPASSPRPVPSGKFDLWWNNKQDVSQRVTNDKEVVVNKDEIATLMLSEVNNAISKIADPAIQTLPLFQLAMSIGLLLNSDQINCAYASRSSNRLPTFYMNRGFCYQDIANIASETINSSGTIRPTMLYYVNASVTDDKIFPVFLKMLFDSFISRVNSASEEQKKALFKELVDAGRGLNIQNKFFDAFAIYQVAQTIYCMFDSYTLMTHQQMIQLFLLKIQAFHKIKEQSSFHADIMSFYISGEKQKGVDFLKLMHSVLSKEEMDLLARFPVTAKLKQLTAPAETEQRLSLR